jgi:anti-sigma B factor antagonist
MAMELKVINTDDVYTHLALVGKLDIMGVGEIENKFIGYTAARKKNALIDLSGVTFLGSMALRLFLSSAKSLKLDHKSLILLNPQPLVNEVLVASGIEDAVVIEHDAEAALGKAKA